MDNLLIHAYSICFASFEDEELIELKAEIRILDALKLQQVCDLN